MQLAMVIGVGVPRFHNLLHREGLRLYSKDLKATLDDMNILLSDAFSYTSVKASLSSPPSESLEDYTDVLSIMCVCQATYLEKCCHIKDAMYGHHVILCWSMDELDSSLSKKLFNFYIRLGSIEDAVYMCGIAKPDKPYWNSLISSCCKNGKTELAFELFKAMKHEEIFPDCFTFAILLKACSSFEESKLLHAQALEYVCDLNVFVKSALVDVYAKWGSIADAHDVFDKMKERTLVSWSVMIAGWVEAGYISEAFETFWQMQLANFQPNEVTFLNILKACTGVSNLENAQKLHCKIVEDEFEVYLVVGNALIDAYARCGSIEDAHNVFLNMRARNVISFTSMIHGLAQQGLIENSFNLFWQMEKQGVKPNYVTISAVLKLCASKVLLDCGNQVHNYILMENMEGTIFVKNCLLDMYVKCGDIEAAQCVFDKISGTDVVSWSTMIVGFAQCAQPHDAFKLYQEMIQKGVEPNEVTYLGLLQACSSSGYLEKGKRIHDYIARGGLEVHLFIGNALVDMYSKGGSVKDAHAVFNRMSKRDLITWNSLLWGYCQHGHAMEAFELFKRMTHEPLKLDHLTFLSLLSACRYAGLVAEGRRYFDIMTKDHRIKPKAEHCACMVDLLGRAGCVHEALALTRKLTIDSIMVWNALLGACKIWGDVQVAETATENIMRLDPDSTSACVQLSNIYAAAGRSGTDLEVEGGEGY